MKLTLYHSMAEADLIAATVYYETQRPGLGIEFLNEVEDAEHRIQRNPKWYPAYGRKAFAFVR